MKALTCIGAITLLLIIWIRISDFLAPIPEPPPIPFGEFPFTEGVIKNCTIVVLDDGSGIVVYPIAGMDGQWKFTNCTFENGKKH